MPTISPLCDVNIVDGLSLYQAGDHVKQLFGVEKAALNYAVLFDLLGRFRAEHGFRKAVHSTLPISYDPKSDAQARFISAIERTGFEADPVDFRDLYVSFPPGTNPKDHDAKPISSFASRIAYVLGRLSRHAEPHIVVITHSYEILWPLQQIAHRNPSAKLAVAYFEKYADFRWQYAKLGDSRSQVDFWPLDLELPKLFGIDSYRDNNEPGKEGTGLTKF